MFNICFALFLGFVLIQLLLCRMLLFLDFTEHLGGWNIKYQGNEEDNIGIPDDLRYKRSDGKQRRCTAMSMPDKKVCEKHYIQMYCNVNFRCPFFYINIHF